VKLSRTEWIMLAVAAVASVGSICLMARAAGIIAQAVASGVVVSP